MMDGFFSLRHDAIVGCNHQNHNVGRLGTTCAHCRKRFVSRRIQKRNHAALGFNVIGTDMLSNSTGFTMSDAGLTNTVKQRRLAMVHVAHHCHHRRARQQLCRMGTDIVFKESIGIVQLRGDRNMTHFLDQNHRRFLIDNLVNRHHRAHLHHQLDDFSGFHRHLMGEIRDRNGFGNVNFTRNKLNRLRWRCRLRSCAVTRAVATATFGATPSRRTGVAACFDRTFLCCVFLPRVLLGSLGFGLVSFASGLMNGASDASSWFLGFLRRCDRRNLLRSFGLGFSASSRLSTLLFFQLCCLHRSETR